MHEVEKAANQAVHFLLSQQQNGGAIADRGNTTAMTALALMAMASVGYLPTDASPEGEAIRTGLAYVLEESQQDARGYFGVKDGSRMYGHGIISLMLAEMLGMGLDEKQDRLTRLRLGKAIDLILWAQDRKAPPDGHNYGGWRYTPESGDSDMSVTIWQLLTLRAAKNAGMTVPKSAIEKAVTYLKRCYQSPRDAAGKPQNLKSACGYQPGSAPSYAMGAAGLLALQICGEYDAPEVIGSADWLRDQKLDPARDFFFYGTYYYAQAMYQRGGEYANDGRNRVEELLLKRQMPDGSWQAPAGQEANAGKVYTTAMGLLSLSVRYHYLPIYQR